MFEIERVPTVREWFLEAHAYLDGLDASMTDIYGAPSLRQISEVVTRVTGVTLTQLKGNRRSRSVAWPRQMFCLLAYQLTGKSFPQIGGWLGGRDHTTIMHAVRSSQERLQVDKEFSEQYGLCLQALED